MRSLGGIGRTGKGLDRSPFRETAPLSLEPLEPRLLLNADLPGIDIVLTDNESRNQDILVRMVERAEAASQSGAVVHRLEVIDRADNNAVLSSERLDQVGSVTINLGGGDDTVTLDLASFGAMAIPDIAVDGGAGEDRIVLVTDAAAEWRIDGDGSGQVQSAGAVIGFAGMEWLIGADDADDTFTLGVGGRLAGGVEGGDGGRDTLVIEGSFAAPTATLSGAVTTLDLDGMLFSYKGIEPVLVGGGDLQVVVLGTTGDDHVVLENGPVEGQFQIRSTNDSFETRVFTNSVMSVVLGLSTGNDSFTATVSADSPFRGNIIIAETSNLTLGSVTGIDGSLSVETFASLNRAAAGELDYDGSSITVRDDAVISLTGDLSLVVNAADVLDASNLQEWISVPIVRGLIDIGQRVSITARDVTAEVNATNAREIFLSIDASRLLEIALADARVAEAEDWGTASFVDNGDGTATLSRSAGTWGADGFAAGQQLLITDTVTDLNQSFRILSVTDTGLIVELPGGTSLPSPLTSGFQAAIGGYAFTQMTGTDLITFGVTTAADGAQRMAISRGVPVVDPDAVLAAGVSLSFDGNTIMRDTGTWAADSFAAGQIIEITGAGERNGSFVVASISGADMILRDFDGAEVSFAAASGVSALVRGHMVGSFADDGFQAGDLVVVQNSAGNDNSYQIAEVGAYVLILETGAIPVPEVIDLTDPNAPQLVLQKVNEDLALADLPLVLMDKDGNLIEGSDGAPLSFTQSELEAAMASQNDLRFEGSDTTIAEDIVSFLVDNPITDFLTGFGFRIIASTVSADVTVGQGSMITARGDVSLVAVSEVEVDGSSPSVVAGLSVVYSKASANIDIASGVVIDAAGDVTLDARTPHQVTADSAVTSGAIVNPLQGAVGGFGSDTAERINPSFGVAFESLTRFIPNVTGFVRVPGPAIAVAVGVIDTDTTVTVSAGAAITGNGISVLANIDEVKDPADVAEGESRFVAVENAYGVSAGATIFQPGRNQGFGVSVAVSVSQSDAIIDIQGDLTTRPGSDGDIIIAAASVNSANSIGAASWVRESKEGVGGAGGLLGDFQTEFSKSVSTLQDNLRDQGALNDLGNENPGKVAGAAGVAVLVSHNLAEVKIAGNITADGSIDVAAMAIDNPNIGASGATEPGADIEISGGIAVSVYENDARVTLLSGAELVAQGDVTVAADALIPNQITIDELIWGNVIAANKQLEDDLAAAEEIADEDEREEAKVEANEAYAEAMNEIVNDWINFPLDIIQNRRWGIFGVEGFLFTSYVNSGGGGSFASDRPEDQVTVLDQNGRAELNPDGTARTKTIKEATNSADYVINGNINIQILSSGAEIAVADGVTITAGGDLTLASNSEMESINLTGLTSLYDIFWATVGRFQSDDAGDDDDDGAKGGFGASVGIRVFDNLARTGVGAGASLTGTSGDVRLTAATRDLHVNIHEIGSDGGDVAISGVVSVDVMSGTTEVLVDESVRIRAGGDVVLDADSAVLQVNVTLTGSETTGKAAIGAAVGVNVVNSTTRAMILDRDGAVANFDPSTVVRDDARIVAGGDVNVEARRSDALIQIALAGSAKTADAPTDGDGGDGGTEPGGIFEGLGNLFGAGTPTDGFNSTWPGSGGNSNNAGGLAPNNTSSAQMANDASGDRGGVAAAGAVIVDFSAATVTAAIGAGATISAAGTVRSKADYQRDSVMIDGGGAIDLSGDGTAALAGAVGIAVAERFVDALVTDAAIFAGALEVEASRRDLLIGVSVGGAGALRSKVAIAGSVNVHVFTGDVNAKVTGSVIDLAGDAEIIARSDRLIVTIAGAVGAVVTGDAGVGAAIGVSSSNEDVRAHLDNTSLTAGGNVTVLAQNEFTLASVVLSAGISVTGAAGAGQLALHLVTGEVDARIGTGSTVAAEGHVGVVAADRITMVTVTGGVGLGGRATIGIAATSTNIYDRKVLAHVDDGASVTAQSNGASLSLAEVPGGAVTVNGVAVQAKADDDMINVVLGVSLSGSRFAGQGSILIDTNASTVEARIGSDQGTATSQATVRAFNGGDVVVDAVHDLVGVSVVGGVAVSLGGSAAGAAIHVHVHHRTVTATVGAHAVVQADGSVRIDADLDVTMRSVIFTGAVAVGSAAFGGAITVAVSNDFVTAQAMRDASVTAGGDIVLDAGHKLQQTVVDAALAASAVSAGITAAIGVVVQNSETKALVGAGAALTAEDTVLLDAVGTTALQIIQGGVAVGGKAGVGASGFVLVRDDKVIAETFAGASLTGRGLGDGVLRATAHDNRPQTSASRSETVQGVAVIADSWEDLIGIAVQGSVGGAAAVAGALPITVITETTTARIGSDNAINRAPGADAGAAQDVILRATDDLLMVHVAGNLAVGGTAGVGIGADITSIIKTTTAEIVGNSATSTNPAQITANRNVIVEAMSRDKLVSVVIGVAVGAKAGVGLNANVYVHDTDTIARIGARADVVAEGSVLVDAAQATDADFIVISVAAGGFAGIGAGVGVAVFDHTTTSTIDADARVVAKGLRAALDGVRTGTIDVGGSSGVTALSVGADGVNVSQQNLSGANSGNFNLGLPTFDTNLDDTDGMFADRKFAAATEEGFRGLSVTASSVSDATSFGGVLAGGAAAIGGSVVVSVITANTTAGIGAGARINDTTGQQGGEQRVRVGAGGAIDHLGIVAGAAVGGVAVLPVVHAGVANLTTTARIDGAFVRAVDDISVRADAHQDVQALGIVLAGGGTAAIAPAVQVLDLTSTTTAAISGAANVEAGGNVVVTAADDTNIDTLGVALAVGGTSVGAAISVVSVDKTTDAIIGSGAEVTARAEGGTVMALSGESTSRDDLDEVRGVIVEAQSRENIDVVGAGGAAGGVAIGGSVAVQFIDSDTRAAIESGATVNAPQSGVDFGTGQSVHVAAFNEVDLFVFAGGVALGTVAASGGVNVADIRNDTAAYIGGSVTARDKVSVAALSDQTVEGVVLAAAGGAVGLAAGVAVYGIGGNNDATDEAGYQFTDENNTQQTASAFTGSSPQASTNTAASNPRSGAIAGLTSELTPPPGADPNAPQPQDKVIVAQVAGAASPASGPVDGDTFTIPQGTAAFIAAGASVTAGGDIDIDARQTSEIDVIVGGVGVGLLGAGGGIGIMTIDNDVTAFVETGSTLSAGGTVSIDARLDQTAELTAFAGAGAAFGALSAGVAVISETSDVEASLRDDVTITRAGAITLKAMSDVTLKPEAIAIAISEGVSGAAAVVDVTVSGDVTASVGENAQIGVSGIDGQTVESLSVNAVSILAIDEPRADQGSQRSPGMAIGGSGGILAGSAGVVTLRDQRDALAYIGAGAQIVVTEELRVEAEAKSGIRALVSGGSGGLIAAGAMIGKIVVTSSATAEIRGTAGRDTRIGAGSVTVESKNISQNYVETTIGSGGFLGVRVSGSTATVTATSKAQIGEDVALVARDTIRIEAKSGIEADSVARAAGGGAVDVGVALATTDINPGVTATSDPTTLASVAEGAMLVAGGDITVRAIYDIDATAFDPTIARVDTVAETISLNNDTGLSTGMRVRYDGPDAAALGLETGRDYSVIRVDDTTIQLGRFFSLDFERDTTVSREPGIGIDTDFDVIRFAQDHGFRSGDRVRYVAESTTQTEQPGDGVLVDGEVYTVRVIDARTIKLVADGQVQTAVTFDARNALVDGTFQIQGHGFSNGDAVTYDGPDSFAVEQNFLQVRLSTAQGATDPLVFDATSNRLALPGYDPLIHGMQLVYQGGEEKQVSFASGAVTNDVPDWPINNQLNHTITLANHGFSSGDAVTYRVGPESDAEAIGGLSDGTTYFVAVLDADTIMLASSSADAISLGQKLDRLPTLIVFIPERIAFTSTGAGTHSFDYVETIGNLVSGRTYTLIPQSSGGQSVPLYELWEGANRMTLDRGDLAEDETHDFFLPGRFPIEGLTDRKTYYIVDSTTDSFRLSETPGGVALDLGDGVLPGVQVISIEGVDFTDTGTGTGRLVIDLLAEGSGRLLAEGGGALADVVTFGGDGQSSATVSGFSVSAVGVTSNTAKLTLKTSVATTIDDASLTSTRGDVRVSADTVTVGRADATTFGIGLLGGFKRSATDVNVQSWTTVSVADGAELTSASGDIRINGNARHEWEVVPRTEGGGLIDVAQSLANIRVTEVNAVTIGDNASLVARDLVEVRALTGGELTSRAWLSNGGLGAGAEANLAGKTWKLAFSATNNVTIGEAATLTGDRLSLIARTADVTMLARAEATSGGFAAGAIATAVAELVANSAIAIAKDAQLTGNAGVVIRADNRDNKVEAVSIARSRSFIGAANSTSDASLTLTASVTAAEGATIFAGPGADPATAALLVAATNPGASNEQIRTPTRAPGVIDFGSNKSEGSKTRNSSIDWDADVVIHAGATPVLEIDEEGNIIEAVNVTVNDGVGVGGKVTGAFHVNDIKPTAYGFVQFLADGGLIEQVTGTKGTFYLLDTFSSVWIENRSGYAMTIRNIDVQADMDKTQPDTQPDVIIDVVSGGNLLEFNVGDAALPTQVDIRQLGGNTGNRTGDLILAGTINNPRGEVVLLAEIGNILSAGVRGFSAEADGITRSPLVIANRASITALAGGIGAPGAALNIDLVSLDVLARDRIGDPNGLEFTPAVIRADAAHDVVVDLKARTRAFAPDSIGSGALVQQVDHIAAGGAILVLLQQGQNELFTPSSGIVKVLAQKGLQKDDGKSGFVAKRYRDDLTATAPDRTFGDKLSAQSAATTTYVFRDLTDSAPGLIAGTDIRIEQAPEIGTAQDVRVNVEGLVDAGADGVLDVLVSGFVTLTENRDNMNVGRIESRYGDVTLVALTGSILDAHEDAEADVLGNAITLTARLGSIGEKGAVADRAHSLDIDSRLGGGAGVVRADAAGDIYLIETAGSIGVAALVSATGNVRLEAASGGIEGAGAAETHVSGNDIDLIARAGGIGSAARMLGVDSAASGAGRLFAEATGTIAIVETARQLTLLRAVSSGGDVILLTPDLIATPDDGAGLGESLLFLSQGGTLLDAPVDHARVSAAGHVTLLVGDDVTMQVNSVIEAGGGVTIFGDHGDADTGFGTTMFLRGAIRPIGGHEGWQALIAGNGDADRFVIEDVFLGGSTRVLGAGDEDSFLVQRLASMSAPLSTAPDGTVSGYALTLDGQSGSDRYEIRTAGSQTRDAAGYRDYVINVLDSGAPTAGEDVLDIYGVDADAHQNGADIFLLRRLAFIPGWETATDPGMVALLHGSLAEVTQTDGRPSEVERINYDAGINGRLSVNGMGGDDAFFADDTSVITTLDGGEGDDLFRIGQVFGSERDTLAALGAGDVFATTQTTSGWLSRGNSAPMLVLGGAGDDDFAVYSNKATLHLDGGAGNDAFTFRAFALSGAPLLYNVNVPVTLDGGAGFDKVTAIGTEFDDAFVITETGVFGAGLGITVAGNEEVRELDAMEGDDTIFALSTRAATLTRVIGGLGSDRFNVTSDVTEPVVSAIADGRIGTLSHGVAVSGDDYAYVALPGLAPIITDPTDISGLVIISESGAGTVVSEQGAVDSYTIRLARAPQPGETVYVTVSAERAAVSDLPADTIWLAATAGFTRSVSVNGVSETRHNRDLVLAFTADNWTQAQVVHVMAATDDVAEGTRTVRINHQVRSTQGSFDAAVVRDVVVTVLENDRPVLVVTQLDANGARDTETRVLEGSGAEAVTDRYALALSRAPEVGEEVRVYLDHDGQIALSGAELQFENGRAYVAFDTDNFADPVIVTVTAVDDAITDGTVISRITHDVVSSGGLYADVGGTSLDVQVVDNETPGLFLVESDGATRVIKGAEGAAPQAGQGDSYTIRLTARPEADVTIDIVSDGQTDATIGGRVFLRDAGTEGDGLYQGGLALDASGMITGDQDWASLGFAAGQMIRVTDGGLGIGDFKIQSVAGSVLHLTGAATPQDGTLVSGTVTRLAAAITFTPDNFAEAVTVGVTADPYFTLAEEARNLRSFAVQPHDLSNIRGALEEIGGVHVPRDLLAAAMLPGERNPDLPARPVALDPTDLTAIDTLNILDDGVMTDRVGVLRGGGSRRLAPLFQPGAQLALAWRARLDAHLGQFRAEVTRSRAGALLD
ncbi:MAG: LEPR-XLL domain-containing protein, partial [Roseovarius sp.]